MKSKGEMKNWRRAERNYGKQKTVDPRRKLIVESLTFLKTTSLVTVNSSNSSSSGGNSIKHGRITEWNPSHPVVGGGLGLQHHHRRHTALHHHHLIPTRSKAANHDPRIGTKMDIGNLKVTLVDRGRTKADNLSWAK